MKTRAAILFWSKSKSTYLCDQRRTVVAQSDFKFVTSQRWYHGYPAIDNAGTVSPRHFRAKHCITALTVMFHCLHTLPLLLQQRVMALEFPTWRFTGLNQQYIEAAYMHRVYGALSCHTPCRFWRYVLPDEDDGRHRTEQQNSQWTKPAEFSRWKYAGKIYKDGLTSDLGYENESLTHWQYTIGNR